VGPPPPPPPPPHMPLYTIFFSSPGVAPRLHPLFFLFPPFRPSGGWEEMRVRCRVWVPFPFSCDRLSIMGSMEVFPRRNKPSVCFRPMAPFFFSFSFCFLPFSPPYRCHTRIVHGRLWTLTALSPVPPHALLEKGIRRDEQFSYRRSPPRLSPLPFLSF